MDKALMVLPSNIVGISRACVVIAMMWLCEGTREELVKGFFFSWWREACERRPLRLKDRSFT